MPRRVVIVIIIVIVFGVFMFSSLIRSCSPHVGFAEARSGAPVQVFGTILREKVEFDSARLVLSFALQDDKGEVLPIVFNGVMPSNFQYARQATCIGAWKEGAFHADRVLLKCPSKYEGQVTNDSLYEFYNEGRKK